MGLHRVAGLWFFAYRRGSCLRYDAETGHVGRPALALVLTVFAHRPPAWVRVARPAVCRCGGLEAGRWHHLLGQGVGIPDARAQRVVPRHAR